MSDKGTIKDSILDGYIQLLCHTPFFVHLHSEEQIFLLKLLNEQRLILHLDATCSVVRKMEKSQNAILYYAISVKNPEARVCPAVPLAEMLSSAHTNVEITLFLTNAYTYSINKVT